MKKYLAWFAFVFMLSVFVNLKHEQYANKTTSDGGNQNFTLFLNDAPQRKDYSPDPNDKTAVWWERGYIYFGWPTGTTIWALVITFAVIAEQTMATRKAAENAGVQLAFQKEALRPRLKITNFKNDVLREALSGKWITVQMEISNSGGIPAYKVIAETWAEFIYGLPPYKFSPSAKYDKVNIENVHASKPSGFILPFNRGLDDQEKTALVNATGTI